MIDGGVRISCIITRAYCATWYTLLGEALSLFRFSLLSSIDKLTKEGRHDGGGAILNININININRRQRDTGHT